MQGQKSNFKLYHGTGLTKGDPILQNIIKDPRSYFKSNCQDPWKGIWCSKDPEVAVKYAAHWNGSKNVAGTMLQVNVLNNTLFVKKKSGKPLQPTDIPKEHWGIDGKGVYVGQHAQGSSQEEYLVKLGENIKVKILLNETIIINDKGYPQLKKF